MITLDTVYYDLFKYFYLFIFYTPCCLKHLPLLPLPSQHNKIHPECIATWHSFLFQMDSKAVYCLQLKCSLWQFFECRYKY